MKLLIVDDHPVLREGLAALLRQAGPDTSVLQARSSRDALNLLDDNDDLDVVILDLMMPGQNGLEALPEFARRRPELPVIVLSSSEDPQIARQAIALGALGYVPKSANPPTLLLAIKLVLNGELYVPPLILDEPATEMRQTYDHASEQGELTDRQIEVLRLIADGQSNKAIAFRLGLSENTVKVHITAIFKALRAINRTQAVRNGRRSGLI